MNPVDHLNNCGHYGFRTFSAPAATVLKVRRRRGQELNYDIRILIMIGDGLTQFCWPPSEFARRRGIFLKSVSGAAGDEAQKWIH